LGGSTLDKSLPIHMDIEAQASDARRDPKNGVTQLSVRSNR